MKVGIIGSGGREHAICETVNKSNKIDKIFCFPGNAGTKDIAENINIDLDNFKILKNFILEKKIDLIIVGPEKPLVEGLVDYLEKFKIKVFGPNKIASQLEGSKIFTKQICDKYNIPTAHFGIFENKMDAKKFLKSTNYPTVVKADNLASGKGVYICNNENDAIIAIDEIFNGKFGEAKNLLIEEFLKGEEMSFFTIHDGTNFKTAFDMIARNLIELDLGSIVTRYRLRDWGISRQRYWGTPIPMYNLPFGEEIPVPLDRLPVLLPENVIIDGVTSPLKTDPDWQRTSHNGQMVKRETDTFDTFMESSWYYARFTCPKTDTSMLDSDLANYWLPVDQYVGGVEHAILHLLYSRFFTKVIQKCNKNFELS